MRSAATSILLTVLAACTGPQPEPADPSAVEQVAAELEVRATAEGLELTNGGEAPVYYRARDPLTLALSDRIPCAEPANCPSVPPRSRVTVPFDEAIVGYRAETERVLVQWWHFIQQADGSVAADEVRTLEVRF